jgi:hypothetical protein
MRRRDMFAVNINDQAIAVAGQKVIKRGPRHGFDPEQ